MTPLLPAFAATPRQDVSALVNRIFCVDCFDLLAAIPGGSASAIITDMPYGTTACAWDTRVDLPMWWKAVKRVLKPRGAFVTTASQPFTSALVMSNPTWFKYSWVWVKNVGSNFLNANHEPMKEHEDIAVFCDKPPVYFEQRIERKDKERAKYAYKADDGNRDGYGAFSFARQFASDIDTRCASSVLYCNRDVGLHPTQKPVALFEYLIKTYTLPGDLILDPFCGSGTTAVAARNLSRQFIAGDFTPEYVEIARKRLAQPWTPPLFAEPVEREPVPVQKPLFAAKEV